MKPFRSYDIGKYQIFRGKKDADTWFVYDTKEERYVGGSFLTKAQAVKWIEERE